MRQCTGLVAVSPNAKEGIWGPRTLEVRKRGERTGLDTPVVHAVNDVY